MRRYHAISGRTPREYRETGLYRDEWMEQNLPRWWAKPAKAGLLRRATQRVVEAALLATLALARVVRGRR